MLKIAFIKKTLGALWLTIFLLIGSVNLFSSSIQVTNTDQNPQKVTSSESSSQTSLHGEVEVSFKIGADGKANILNIKSENPDLVKYVRTKLNKIQLQKDDFNINEIITYRFIFKKEA